MDNLRFKIENKRIAYNTILSFNENYSTLVVPSEKNIVEKNNINSSFRIYNRNTLGKINKEKFFEKKYQITESSQNFADCYIISGVTLNSCS